jgi:hypothetical protein
MTYIRRYFDQTRIGGAYAASQQGSLFHSPTCVRRAYLRIRRINQERLSAFRITDLQQSGFRQLFLERVAD